LRLAKSGVGFDSDFTSLQVTVYSLKNPRLFFSVSEFTTYLIAVGENKEQKAVDS
jgi:hypothetical protein